ncbi:MAG: DUF3662 domain-containing protein [Candidatus Eremiobacteraeota bacterium]|nr:DUF3662 domain-containing protein [Candidatus Eremiobacteraeota bacterium]MBC5803059.1 DUF3662 domain-containing protein [Candidatus Eremiobacteraeota bacterium]MBC5820519.1 DUF3662 domain-containing protein [Candidatus Eremiobacteraeota bacterium]
MERTFAFAFPSALEPVQIARKLVANFEAAAVVDERRGRCFTVQLHPSDYARLENELPYLERQWTAMLARLAERSRRPQRTPEVRARSDASVAAGTITISSVSRPQAERLVLRVRRGIAPRREVALNRTLVVGREPACDVVLADSRVSRRHCVVEIEDGVPHVRDLGSSNGTLLNGTRVGTSALGCGDVLALGDTELLVDAVGDGPAAV